MQTPFGSGFVIPPPIKVPYSAICGLHPFRIVPDILQAIFSTSHPSIRLPFFISLLYFHLLHMKENVTNPIWVRCFYPGLNPITSYAPFFFLRTVHPCLC